MAATAEPGMLDGLKEKLVQITLWLKKIYGDQPIPQYEVNEKTVDILYDLMECSEARDKDVSLLVEELKHQTTEYKKQTKELEDSLRKSLGLSLSSLCNEATGSLSNLVESAMILETKDTSLISFSCAINSKTSELFEKESENREMERKWNTKRKKLMSALALERQLQEAVKDIEKCQTIENTKMENRSKNLEFLRHKSLELKIRTRAAEEEIIVKGLDKTLTHEALVQLSEELAALQKELVCLKKELKTYYDLPPSIALARVKVEESKREQDASEEELSKLLEKLPFELT